MLASRKWPKVLCLALLPHLSVVGGASTMAAQAELSTLLTPTSSSRGLSSLQLAERSLLSMLIGAHNVAAHGKTSFSAFIQNNESTSFSRSMDVASFFSSSSSEASTFGEDSDEENTSDQYSDDDSSDSDSDNSDSDRSSGSRSSSSEESLELWEEWDFSGGASRRGKGGGKGRGKGRGKGKGRGYHGRGGGVRWSGSSGRGGGRGGGGRAPQRSSYDSKPGSGRKSKEGEGAHGAAKDDDEWDGEPLESALEPLVLRRRQSRQRT